MNKVLVTGYVNPDLDAVAGLIGYAEYLTKTGRLVTPGIIGIPHDEAKYLLDTYNIQYPVTVSNANIYDEIVLVDASDLNGLEGRVLPSKVVEVIDHRTVNDATSFPNAVIQIELVGAAATLIAEKFIKQQVDISKESAILIYGAIISNTLNFKATVTTERDRQAAQWLKQKIQLPDSFIYDLFKAKSDLTGSKLAERIKQDFAWFELGGKKLGIAQLEVVGAKELVDSRGEEIVKILESVKNEMGLDLIFQNTIDLEEGQNYLVTNNTPTQELLERTLDVKFKGITAIREKVLMRKQIVPILKQALE